MKNMTLPPAAAITENSSRTAQLIHTLMKMIQDTNHACQATLKLENATATNGDTVV